VLRAEAGDAGGLTLCRDLGLGRTERFLNRGDLERERFRSSLGGDELLGEAGGLLPGDGGDVERPAQLVRLEPCGVAAAGERVTPAGEGRDLLGRGRRSGGRAGRRSGRRGSLTERH